MLAFDWQKTLKFPEIDGLFIPVRCEEDLLSGRVVMVTDNTVYHLVPSAEALFPADLEV